jgi:hypothetical protein
MPTVDESRIQVVNSDVFNLNERGHFSRPQPQLTAAAHSPPNEDIGPRAGAAARET